MKVTLDDKDVCLAIGEYVKNTLNLLDADIVTVDYCGSEIEVEVELARGPDKPKAAK